MTDATWLLLMTLATALIGAFTVAFGVATLVQTDPKHHTTGILALLCIASGICLVTYAVLVDG